MREEENAEKQEIMFAIEIAFQNRHPEVLIFDSWVTWKKLLYECENEYNRLNPTKRTVIKYVVYLNSNDRGGWRISAVPKNLGAVNNQQTPYQQSLNMRSSFPPSWCGLENEALFVMSNIEGSVFVGLSGFLAVNRTQEGALQMALKSLNSVERKEQFRDQVATRLSRIETFLSAVAGLSEAQMGNDGTYSILKKKCLCHEAIGREMLALGNVEGAIGHFEKSCDIVFQYFDNFYEDGMDHSEKPMKSDPADNFIDMRVVFYAESLEHGGKHADAAKLLLHLYDVAGEKGIPTPRLAFPICSLVLLKLFYVSPASQGGGRAYLAEVLPLVREIDLFPDNLKLRLKALFKSHWAYFVFIKALSFDENESHYDQSALFFNYSLGDKFCDMAKASSKTQGNLPYKPLFIVGDSHCLTYSWRTVTFQEEFRTICPFLVTGIKAFHTRRGTKFYTHTALHLAMAEMQKSGASELLFSAGEIDVREGISVAVDRGKYESVEVATQQTATEFVVALEQLAEVYQLSIMLLPVAPHANRPGKSGRWKNRLERRKISVLFNQTLQRTCKPENGVCFLNYLDKLYASPSPKAQGGVVAKDPYADKVLDPIYDSDKTHLNRRALRLLDESLDCVVK